MSVMENWVALNRKNDALPPTPARTILNFIQSFLGQMNALGLTDLLAAMTAHIQDTNNPHHIRISNVPDLVVDALWDYFQSGSGQVDPTLWSSKEAMVASFDAYPPLILEYMRQIILNTDFKYRDGVGPFKPGSPLYQLTRSTPVPVAIPFYSSTTDCRDLDYYINGNLTGLLGSEGSAGMTLFYSFRIQSDAINTGIWVCYLGSDGSGTNSIIATYVAAANQLTITSTSTLHSLTPSTIQFPLKSTTGSEYVELRFAMEVTPTGLILYAFRDGVFTSQEVAWDTPALLTEFTAVTVSHDIWDCMTDETATKAVLVYNLISDTGTIERILSSI